MNGAQGLSEVLAQAMSQGVTGLQLARNLLAGQATGPPGNGAGPAPGAPVKKAVPASEMTSHIGLLVK